MLPEKLTNLNFLLVDDFESIRIMLTASLNKMGIKKIKTASSGNQALKLIAESAGKPEQIQFVISDFNMPDGTGLQLIQGIRANPALQKLPFLLLTSQSEIEVVLSCVQAGANDYLIKPWKDDELMKKLTNISKII